MKTQIRRQLTLFLKPEEATAIESVRKEYNPIQYELISSHITLCREDEIESLSKVIKNLNELNFNQITLTTKEFLRFENNKGVLLNFEESNCFQEIRKQLLKDSIEQPRNHQPHITLIHPRNGTCTDEIFQKLQKIKFPEQFSFEKVSLIEQEVGNKWKILAEYSL